MALTVDVLQYGTGSHPTPSEAANYLATDFIADGAVGAITNTGGVSPATGAFAVNSSGSADGSLAIAAGAAYATGTPTSQGSQRLRVKNSATATLALTANSTGSTRYDWIYIKLDPTNMANPNIAADNVATLVSSRSTSNSVDNGTPPTYGYNIAIVTTANGFTTGSTISNGSITDKRTQTSAAVLASQAPTGMPVQVVSTQTSAVATGTTTVPQDDTIPQNTEGDQYMTLSITPKSATNVLYIDVDAHISNSAASTQDLTGALFQDSTANALSTDNSTMPGAGYVTHLKINYSMVAGTTSSTTFKFRAGAAQAGTTTFNGQFGARRFGGVFYSSIKITEVKA